jgi:ABC-2 type transport system ATP-binding protein
VIEIIELRDLSKYYGNTKGIEGLDLKVEQGEVFGYLGPNASAEQYEDLS